MATWLQQRAAAAKLSSFCSVGSGYAVVASYSPNFEIRKAGWSQSSRCRYSECRATVMSNLQSQCRRFLDLNLPPGDTPQLDFGYRFGPRLATTRGYLRPRCRPSDGLDGLGRSLVPRLLREVEGFSKFRCAAGKRCCKEAIWESVSADLHAATTRAFSASSSGEVRWHT